MKREVLRFIPPATSLMRQAVKPDQIPLSSPVTLRNGEQVTSIPIVSLSPFSPVALSLSSMFSTFPTSHLVLVF